MENGTENKNPATHGKRSAHAVATAKRKRIMIIAAVCLISVVIMAIAIPNCGGGTQGIEVISETLVTTPYYAAINGYLYPILLVKVKNTSNVTKKVSFEANFYADGNLLGSGLADFVTLAPGRRGYSRSAERQGLSFTYKPRIHLQDNQVERLLLTRLSLVRKRGIFI